MKVRGFSAAAKESGRGLLAVESVTEQRLSRRKLEAYLDSGIGER